MPLDLDAIEARTNAANLGPTRVERNDMESGAIDWLVIEQGGDRDGSDAFVCGIDAENTTRAKAKAEFIAAARTDIPALIARVRELERDVGAFLDGIAEIRHLAASALCTDPDTASAIEFVEELARERDELRDVAVTDGARLRAIHAYLDTAGLQGAVDATREWEGLADEDRERLEHWGARVAQAGMDTCEEENGDLTDALDASRARVRELWTAVRAVEAVGPDYLRAVEWLRAHLRMGA